MSAPDGAARGRALLTERIAEAPEAVARVPRLIEPLLERPVPLPRMLVTTGIGTSEGHARHLAEAASRFAGQPARFAATGALARGAPPGAERDWLVIFSQGLSANARHALLHAERWAGVVLVTGLPRPGADGFASLDREKRDWLELLAAGGGVQVAMGCGEEYGTLLRVVGARVGYAIAWSLLRTLAVRRLESLPVLDAAPGRLALVQRSAGERLDRVFPPQDPVAPFLDAARPLLLVAEGGYLELAHQLSLKIAEGCLRPPPLAVDVLHFAHGPLQSVATRPASFLYLEVGGATGGARTPWCERLARTLDPDLHDLRVLSAAEAEPFCVLEHEAMLDALVLRALGETGVDIVDWPGADREAPLYARAPARPPTPPARSATSRPRLEESVWPEIEAALAAGRRTAILPLGSVEQHGPHLPLGTDRWIAEALGERLAARRPDATVLPAVPVGCAREHLDFPGTLHVDPATLEALLGDLLDSLVAHGFARAFVFTAHGGNVDALEAMRERLVGRARPLELVLETDLPAVAALQAEAVVAAGLESESAGPHAGEFETSIVAALRPGAVRRAALAPGRRASPETAQALFHPTLRRHAPSGVLGDPRAADAARGEAYLDAWVAWLERACRAAFGDAAPASGSPKKRA